MIIKKILLGIAVLGGFVGQVMAGPLSLQNATITGTFSGGGAQFANGTVQVVDPFGGFEYLTEDSNFNQFFFVDFDDAGLVSVFNTIGDLVSPPNQILTFTFAGLSENIVGVSSPINGLNLSLLSSNSIKIDLSNVTWGDEFSSLPAQLVFAAPTVVPEPGTLALLGLGLAGLVSLRRRKI